METEKNLTQQESFEVISRMIQTAQNDIQDDSFYYLVWGWLVFIASGSQYLLAQLAFELSFLPWVILMPLGGILTGIYSYRHERKKKVRTYIDDLMKYVLISFLVSMMTVLFFQSKLGLGTYPLIMMIYGVWLFISGGAIKFQPLIIGGVINWALGIISFFFDFETQLLLIGAAVLLGYIIPGYLLKNKYRSQQSQTATT